MKNKKEAMAYAKELIKTLTDFEEASEEKGLIPPVFDLWMILLQEKCRIRLKEYLDGKSDTYKLTDTEVGEAYNKATSDWVGESIADMVSTGLVQVSISEKGEMIYSLTEKGENIANELENED